MAIFKFDIKRSALVRQSYNKVMNEHTAQLFECLGEFGFSVPSFKIQDAKVQRVKQLIKAGADPNGYNENGETPLGMMASLFSKPTEFILLLVDTLLGAGANPMQYDQPLLKLTTHNSLEIRDAMPMVLMSKMLKQPQEALETYRSQEGLNPLQMMALHSPDTFSMMFAYFDAAPGERVMKWATEPGDSGNTAFHLLWGAGEDMPAAFTGFDENRNQQEVYSALLAINLARHHEDVLALENTGGETVMDLIIKRVHQGIELQRITDGEALLGTIGSEITARELIQSTQNHSVSKPSSRRF